MRCSFIRQGLPYLLAFFMMLALAPGSLAQSLSLSPACVLGGNPVNGTVRLAKPAAVPIVIRLAASGSLATVPATITIQAGDSSAAFTVTTLATNYPEFVKVTARTKTVAAAAYLRVSQPTGYAESPWPSVHGDGDNTSQSFPVDIKGKASRSLDFSGQRQPVWSDDTGEDPNPVIGPDGTVYFIGRQDETHEDQTQINWTLFAVDVSSGKAARQYTFADDKVVGTPIAMGANGLIYALSGSQDGTGYVSAIDASTAQLEWKKPTGTFITAFSPPSAFAITPDGSVCVAGSTESGSGVITDFDGETGSQKWQAQVDEGGVPSLPVISPDGTVYVKLIRSDRTSLIALNGSNGQVDWTIDLQVGAFNARDYTDPVVGPDGTIYVGAGPSIYAVDGSTGQVKWHYYNAGVWWSLALATNGMLYGVSAPDMYSTAVFAISPETGGMKWKCSDLRFVFDGRSILAADGTLWCYAVDTHAKLPGGAWPTGLCAIDARTGKLASFAKCPGSAFAVTTGGAVYSGTNMKLFRTN
jgi:outer membrane protein assembly factor BamB